MMKKLLLVLTSIISFVFMVNYTNSQIKADTVTSTVSFTVKTGNLTLNSVPDLTFSTDKNSEKNPSLYLLRSSSEKKYAAFINNNNSNALTVTDYRGATNSNWAVYAQFSSDNDAVININTNSSSQITLSSDNSKVSSNTANTAGKTKTTVKNSELKVNKKQSTNLSNINGTVTWTLADTAATSH
jgi:hypothetical protein